MVRKITFFALIFSFFIFQATICAQHVNVNPQINRANRISACTKITNAGISCLQTLKAKTIRFKDFAVGRYYATAHKLSDFFAQLYYPAAKAAYQTTSFNKYEILSCALIACAAGGGLYIIVNDIDALYSIPFIFNRLIAFCEIGSLNTIDNILLQPLLFKKINNPMVGYFLNSAHKSLIIYRVRNERVAKSKLAAVAAGQVFFIFLHCISDKYTCLLQELISSIFFTVIMRQRGDDSLLQYAIRNKMLYDPEEFLQDSAYCRPRFSQFLITCGADVNYHNSQGLGAIELAVGTNQPDIVKKLLQHGAQTGLALPIAVTNNRFEICKELLKYNADPKQLIPDTDMDLLNYAKSQHYEQIWQLLRNKRCDDLSLTFKQYLKIRDVILIIVDYE